MQGKEKTGQSTQEDAGLSHPIPNCAASLSKRVAHLGKKRQSGQIASLHHPILGRGEIQQDLTALCTE